MTDQDKVRTVVARFFNVPEAKVAESFVFPPERLNASVARATFHAAIKRMAGVDLPAAFTAKTFGDLWLQPSNRSAAGVPSTACSAPSDSPAMSADGSSTQGSGVGLDIEPLSSMPPASDYWAEPFYLENFTQAEIGHCQRQANPQQSFCGIWCAKEAVRKCRPDLFQLRMREVEVRYDLVGKPGLAIFRDGKWINKIGLKLSISHASGIAVAVCVADTSQVSSVASDSTPGGYSVRGLAWLALILGILNTIVWLIFAAKHK